MPEDGDLILVKLKEEKDFTLRELLIDPPHWQLQPIVVGSSVLPFSEQQTPNYGRCCFNVAFYT